MHSMWLRFLVKFYSGTIPMARLLELRSGITVSAKPPFFGGGAGGWAQSLWKSWDVEPSCHFNVHTATLQAMWILKQE